jgi:BirA family biotin operon repressor/biotin-[acetyl-CoA-carboxylase] ligase
LEPVHVILESCGSTNREAAELFARHGGLPCVVRSAEQRGGLGRGGREWVSPVGGLWWSLAWPLSGRLQQVGGAIPLAAGIAACRAIHRVAGVAVSIKWPNDLYAAGRKLGGILCEARPSGEHPCLVVGIGLNANNPMVLAAGSYRVPPVALIDVKGDPVDLDDLAETLEAELLPLLAMLPLEGFPPLRNELLALLLHVGDQIEFDAIGGDQPVVGRMLGVDDSGCLLMETVDGRRTFSAGEIARVRPLARS